MKGQKCSNCGKYMPLNEAIIYNTLNIVSKLGKLIAKKKVYGVIGINTLSNATNIKCPHCGAVNRWIREDE